MTAHLRNKSSGFVFLRRFLEPRFVLFGITLIYFLSKLIITLGQRDNAFLVDQWGFVRRSMIYPFLLLLSCLLVLNRRFVPLVLAMPIAAAVMYTIGYRGLVGASNTQDGSVVGILDTLRIWFDVLPSNLIVETVLAVVIFVFGTAELARLLRRRRKPRS